MSSVRYSISLLFAVAVVLAIAVPFAGARADGFDGNVCGLLGTSALKAANLPATCKELPSRSSSVGALGTLTFSGALYGKPITRAHQKVHVAFVGVIKASNPSAVLAYLRQNKQLFLHQLGVSGFTQSVGASFGERWFLAGGSYGCYLSLGDQGASRRHVTRALNAMQAAVKAGIEG